MYSIATDIKAHQEIYGGGKEFVEIVNAGNLEDLPAKLAAAIEKGLSKSPEELFRLGMVSYLWASKDYSWEKVAARVGDKYEEVIEQSMSKGKEYYLIPLLRPQGS